MTQLRFKLFLLMWVVLTEMPLAIAQMGNPTPTQASKPFFDLTVSLGTLLHLGGVIAGGVALYHKIIGRILVVETKLDFVLKQYEKEGGRGTE